MGKSEVTTGTDPGAVTALFDRFLVQHAEPTAEDLATLCATQPTAVAAALRARFADWQAGAGFLSARSTPLDAAEMVRRLRQRQQTRNRYELRHRINAGGMGEIWEARDLDLDRTVALKRMLLTAPGGQALTEVEIDERRTRLVEEAYITGVLDHPGIPAVYDYDFDADGRPYFTMPLIRGRSLSDIIGDARAGADGWDLRRVVQLLQRVAEALAFAHARGVIHRDIKPDNIMVGAHGEAYVLDWGIALILEPGADGRNGDDPAQLTAIRSRRRDLADTDLFTMAAGTPEYMAPEQENGIRDEIDRRSDVRGLGAVLYQLLVGHPPYREPGAQAHRLRLRLRRGPPPKVLRLKPDTPVGLALICDKAMAHRPDDRHDSAHEFAEDLRAFLEHRPLVTVPTPVLQAVRLAARRHRVATAVGAVGAVILLLTVAVAFYLQRRTSDYVMAEALLAQERTLFPVWPERAAAMRDWLAEVDALIERRHGYRVEARLGRWTPPPNGAEREQMIANIDTLERRRVYIAALLDQAVTLVERSTGSADARDAWDRAKEAISAAAAYRAGGQVLQIEPLTGLLPLGPNEQGLWEFWVVASGNRPTWSARLGGYAPATAAGGVVMVLIPGGRYRFGSDGAVGNEAMMLRPGEADFPPWLTAKFEVTQAQFERLMGSNPSSYAAGHSFEDIDGLHPVENVSWDEATECARRIGLRLLRDTEWEVACRAGTWRTDPLGALTADVQENEIFSDWNDSKIHHPVGSFGTNRFGLADMYGNVSEWCADEFDPRSIQQVDAWQNWPQRLARGYSAFHRFDAVNCSRRNWYHRLRRDFATGFRLAGDVAGHAYLSRGSGDAASPQTK